METIRALMLAQTAILDLPYDMGTKHSNLQPKEVQGEIWLSGQRAVLFTSHLWPPWSRIWAEEDSGSKGLPG